MALVVAVGSLVEEDHEQGVAHILEHLAFNATEARSFLFSFSSVVRAQ